MKTIALVSTCGRAGRTTLTATLSAMLARRGHRVLAVELDPQNLLSMHLGLASFPVQGLAARHRDEAGWADTALQNSDGVTFLPYGQATPGELYAFEQALAAAPDWLARRLAMIADADDMIALVDTARLPSVYAAQAIRAADYVMVLVQAEGEFFATLNLAAQWTEAKPHGFVVNAFDSGRTLQQDVLAALLAQLGGRLSPYLIHRDESLPAAFAKLAFVADAFPQSLAMHDLQGQCDWLLRQIGIESSPVDGTTAPEALAGAGRAAAPGPGEA